MTGALILTAGIRAMSSAEDITLAVAGYVVMRVAMVMQWLRAARADPAHRGTARRYALGIGLAQVAWVALAWAPPSLLRPGFVAFAAVELLVPVWAEQSGPTPWHRHHIAERYGLMTIIVLGESILAASGAVYQALTNGPAFASLAPVIAGGLLIVYALWWVYFDRPAHPLLTSLRRAFIWGYGHYVVFAAAAAVGAGLAAAIDHAAGRAVLSATTAGAAVALPVAIYLGVLWALVGREGHTTVPWMAPIAIGLILLTPLTGQAAAWTGIVLVGLIALKLAARHRAEAAG
jgi:low temperature requirement protein LtrA